MLRTNNTNDTIFYKVRNGRCKLHRFLGKKTNFRSFNSYFTVLFLVNLRFQVDQEILTLHVAGASMSILYCSLSFL